ncbi:MAG: hypothetical protein IJK37_04380 [Prevotella sp.]|nr:hypothetical protein [Prevotella sp.]
MSDTNSKLHLRKWQNRINRLSYGELENIIATPDIYNPDYWELAKKRMDKLSSVQEHEVMRDLVKQCLKEMGCPCKVTKDGDLDFYFQGSHFLITLSVDHHYLDIEEFCWKKVRIDNTEVVKQLKLAVNYANSNCSVITYYDTDIDEQYLCLYCTTHILYRPAISNLKDYLDIRLNNFFFAHDLVNSEMTLMAEREKRDQFEQDLLNIGEHDNDAN